MTSVRDMVLTLGIYLVAFAAITYFGLTTLAIAHLSPGESCPVCIKTVPESSRMITLNK